LRRDELGRGLRYCFPCVDKYGEVGLIQRFDERSNPASPAALKEIIASRSRTVAILEKALAKAKQEGESATKTLTQKRAQFLIVVPFPKSGQETTH